MPIGKEIYLDGQRWKITSVMYIGERYYTLVSNKGVISLLTSTVLENKLKGNNRKNLTKNG